MEEIWASENVQSQICRGGGSNNQSYSGCPETHFGSGIFEIQQYLANLKVSVHGQTERWTHRQTP